MSAAFRAALARAPFAERDAWVDAFLGIDEVPDDDPSLPRGCVPYLPCAVDVLMRMVDQAGVRDNDVFVDVGSGVGRAAAFVHLLSGAEVIGIEIQPALVQASRERFPHLSVLEGDAASLGVERGTVFFLYCPFSGERLETLLAALPRDHEIRVCCVDLPLPPCAWLTLESTSEGDLAIYRSR